LIALRTELAAAIMAGDRIEPGFLAMLAHADAAIGVLDRLPVDDAEPAARVVVADDGDEIRLALYRQNGEAAAVVGLPPLRALALAGEPIALKPRPSRSRLRPDLRIQPLLQIRVMARWRPAALSFR
jgi:hypothetical protein